MNSLEAQDPAGSDEGATSAPYLVLFLISFAALGAELYLTRILSLKYLSHNVYSIVAVAILGYGIGSIHALRMLTASPSSDRRIDRALFRLGASYVLSAGALAALPVLGVAGPQGMSGSSYLSMLAAYAFALPPFIVTGFIITNLFHGKTNDSGGLYAADLLGGACGILSYFLLIRLFGAFRSLLVMGMIASASPLVLNRGVERRRFIAGAVVIMAIGIAGFLVPEKSWPIEIEPIKERNFLLSRPDIDESELRNVVWHEQARTDLLHFGRLDRLVGRAPGLSGTLEVPARGLREGYYFVHDGIAGAPVYPFDALARDTLPFTIPMEAPYLFVNRPSVLVIGVGGGRDLFIASVHGATRLRGAEINRGVYEAMTDGELARFSGDIYRRPGTEITFEDGRHLVKLLLTRRQELFDLIILNGVDSYNALASGAYTYSESYLYTQEAIEEYLSLLSDTGVLNMNRWFHRLRPRETLRLYGMVFEALKKYDAHPERCIAIINSGAWGILIARKTPFRDDEIERLLDYVATINRGLPDTAATRIIAAAGRDLPGVDFGVSWRAPFVQYAAASLSGQLDPFLASYPFDVTAVHDDRPFFYANIRFGDGLRTWYEPGIAGYQGDKWNVLMPVITSLVAFAMTLLFFALPLRRARSPHGRASILVAAGYFLGLGLGFILLEITLLQKFVLILGHPMHALSTGLASMLAGAGCASRFWRDRGRLFAKAAPLLVGGLIAWLFAVDWAMLGPAAQAAAWSLPARMFLAASVIFVSGFLVGSFFPYGLSSWRAMGDWFLPWALAINTGATVCGMCLSIFMARMYGFRSCFAAATLCYLAATAAIWWMGRRWERGASTAAL